MVFWVLMGIRKCNEKLSVTEPSDTAALVPDPHRFDSDKDGVGCES